MYYNNNLALTNNSSQQYIGSKKTQTTTKVADVTQLTNKFGLPFARSIPVLLELRGMKPFTSLYGFIDSSNINANIFSCTKIVINTEVGKFLGAGNFTAPNSWNAIRDWNTKDYQGDLQSKYPNGSWSHSNILAVGEVIRHYINSTNFVAAVVIAREIEIDPVTKVASTVLYVAYMRNYQTITANTDNFVSFPTGWTQGSPFQNGWSIKGDSSGATGVVVSVSTPSTITTNGNGNWFGSYLIPSGQVNTGKHTITLTDDSNNSGQGSTLGFAEFESYGEINAYTRTITNRIDTFVTNTYQAVSWSDPLAETFIIPKEKSNGCFVTSVDLFFSDVNPNETQPVTVQICDTVNGYPGAGLLFNASSQLPPSKIKTSTNGQTATKFKFAGPVFLESGKEYCIKVLSNSTSYRVWISQMGDADINNPTKYVSQQPYLGVLFKSQNNSTWTADQTQDLKFVLYQAQFDSNVSGLVTLQNQANTSSLMLLPVNPVSVANGSTVCKIHFPNHGLFVGAYVDFTNSTYANANGRFSVQKVINDDYITITLGSAAAFTGMTGGNVMNATKSIKYEMLNVDIGTDYSLRTNTFMSIAALQSSSTSKDTSTVSITSQNQIQSASKFVHSDLNESLILGGKKSLDVNLNITSTSNDLSPMLNRHTLAAFLISNKVNVPTSTDSVAPDVNTLISALASVVFSTTLDTITIPTSVDINLFKIGAYITITGTSSNNITTKILDVDKTTSPFTVYVNSNLTNESPATTTITQANGYVDEISPSGGTTSAKYQTMRLALDSLASGMQINFAASIPSTADIQLYYRSTTNNAKPLDDIKWTAIPMAYVKSATVKFIDQEYTVNAIPFYNIVQWKIVMTSTDPTQVPLIKDFRAICLA